MDIYSSDVKLPSPPAAVHWCQVLHEKQVDRTLWKKKITICDCLALVPCRKFQGWRAGLGPKEYLWTTCGPTPLTNQRDPLSLRPQRPVQELRAVPRAACYYASLRRVKLPLLLVPYAAAAPSVGRRKRYILKEPKPFHREDQTPLTWEPSPNSRSPP